MGGASVGDHDLVKPCLEAAGCTVDFHTIAMKPGKPLLLGHRGERGAGGVRVLGLPGNPVSALVTLALFGLPLLRALQGATEVLPPLRQVVLGEPLQKAAGRAEFPRVRVTDEGGVRTARRSGLQASNSVGPLAAADALLYVPAEATRLEAGALVPAYFLRELGL